jgi:hypothetical protein
MSVHERRRSAARNPWRAPILCAGFAAFILLALAVGPWAVVPLGVFLWAWLVYPWGR